MGVTTVIKDYGTDILNAIRENDLKKLKGILDKQLKSDSKIARLCVSDIKHRPTKKFACPLILASRQEDPAIITYMLEKGVDPNFVHHTIFSSKRREIVTSLHIAVDLGYYDTVEVLLAANADANIGDHNQETPLHIAVKKADRIMVRMLLSKGADPAIPDRRGNASLHTATLYGHLQLVKTMLKYDADVYQKGQYDAIPPHIAAKEGHIHLIQLFCSRDVGNINIKIPCYADKREKAPIHLAAENGHIETIRSLLSQFDADVNLKDSDGNTPLHCCVINEYDPHRMRDKDDFNETARVLVKNRVSINEKNVYGDTALHLAAMHHFQRIVELLLEVGANPFVENEEGLKPIDVVPDSDPVTKNVLKMAMLNPRPIANLSYSTDTLQKGIDNTLDSNMRHAMLADGVVLSSSQGTPENALDQSLTRSVSGTSFPSVFEDNASHGRELPPRPMEDHQGLGRVPIKAQIPGQPGTRSGQVQVGQNGQSANQRQGNNTSKGSDEVFEDENRNDIYNNITENEIPAYTKVDKKNKKKRKDQDPSRLKDQYRNDDDNISYVTQSSMADDASSVFSIGAGNANAVVQREIQKLFSKQQNVQKQKKKKKPESVTSDTTSYLDDASITASEITDPMDQSFEKSISLDSQNYVPMNSVEKRKKKKKKAKEPDEKENRAEYDPYLDDEDPYENLGAASLADSQISDISSVSDIKKKKGKKSKSRTKLDQVLANATRKGQQDMVPFESPGKIAKPQADHGLQPGSVKVNTVPGKPGTIEVQYSGGPICISVDTSNVGQMADGQYYFTDQHGNQFPVDVQSAQELAYLQELTSGSRDAPPRPQKAEPIYANQEELFGNNKGRKHFRPAPIPPSQSDEYPDVSGITNSSSVRITEMEDSQDYSEDEDELSPSESDDVNDVIMRTVREATETPKRKGQNLSERGTPTKGANTKPVAKARTSKGEGTPSKERKTKATEKSKKKVAEEELPSDEEELEQDDKYEPDRSADKKPPKAMVITRAVSLQEKSEEDWNASPDESPNVSPQYKSFADKLKWAKSTAGEKPKPQPKPKKGRPPLKSQEEIEEEKRKQKRKKDRRMPRLPETPEEEGEEDDLNMSVSDNEILDEEDTSESESSSSGSEDDSVLVSPWKKKDKQTNQEHKKIYSLTHGVEEDDSESSNGSSDGQSSVVHKPKPKPEPRKLHFRETQSNVVIALEKKHEEITRLEVMPDDEKQDEDLDIETYDREPGARKPKVKPRKPRKSEQQKEEEPLPPPNEDESPIQKTISSLESQSKDVGSTEELEQYLEEPGANREGRSRDKKGLSLEEVSRLSNENDRSQSVDSIVSEYSEGGTRKLKMRVTGEVPKAYNKKQKDTARRAFILRKKNEYVESDSGTSDAEFGSRGSLDRALSPHNRWSKEARPLHAKSPEGLLPRHSPLDPSKLSPIPPEKQAMIQKGKKKLIGAYAKPYKSFGKIETKTDALEDPDMWIHSPATSPLSLSSPLSPSQLDKSSSDKSESDKSPSSQSKPVAFQSAEVKLNKSSPDPEKVDLVKPQPITAHPTDNVVVCSSLAAVKSLPKEGLEQADKLESEPAPIENNVEIGLSTSAFKKNIRILEPGPEIHHSENVTQDIVQEVNTAIKEVMQPPQVQDTDKKKLTQKKTVSVRETKVSESGEVLETVTTTVLSEKKPKPQVIKVDLLAGESSSETETSESEDETDSDESDRSDEGMMEYIPEKGKVMKKKPVKEEKIKPMKKESVEEEESKPKTIIGIATPAAMNSELKDVLKKRRESQEASEKVHEQDMDLSTTASKSENLEHYQSEPGARRPRPSQPENKTEDLDPEYVDDEEIYFTSADSTASTDTVISSTGSDISQITVIDRFEHRFDIDPLKSKAKEKKKRPPLRLNSTEPEATEVPKTPSYVQQDRIKETDLDELVAEETIVSVSRSKSQSEETSLDDVMKANEEDALEPHFDQYAEEPGRRRPRPKATETVAAPISVTRPTYAPPPPPAETSKPQESNDDAATSQGQPKKERIKGRRQIGAPKRGQREHLAVSQENLSKPPTAGQSHNVSFGPEDEEVASINTHAKSRKEAVKAKKLREHEWAMKQKAKQEEVQEDVASEWDQALMAAQAQHGKIPSQLKKQGKKDKSKEPDEQSNSRTITPIRGVEITITGNVGEVTGPNQGNNQMMPEGLKDKAAEDDKGKMGFLTFPSKRKKDKDKLKASQSAEDLTGDGDKKKGIFGIGKKKQKDKLNTSIASEEEEGMYESLNDLDQIVPPQTPQSGDATSPQLSSPEGYGIEQTVMGAKIERDETVRENPELAKRGGFFNLPSVRKKKDFAEEDKPSDAPEVVPNQSGMSQNEILARMMRGNQKGSGQGARQAAMDENSASQDQQQPHEIGNPGPPLPPPDFQRPPLPGKNDAPKETCIDDDLEILPSPAKQTNTVNLAQQNHQPMETNIDDDLPYEPAPTIPAHSHPGSMASDEPLPPRHQMETNLDDLIPADQDQPANYLDEPIPLEEEPQTFNRNANVRKSKGRRKGKRGPPSRGSASEEPPSATSSGVYEDLEPLVNGHQSEPRALQPVDDTALVSQLWKSKKDQEEDMMRVLASTQAGNNMASVDDGLYEQPVCHRDHDLHGVPSPPAERRQHRGRTRPQAMDGSNDKQLQDAAMEAILHQQHPHQQYPGQGRPPLPAHRPPAGQPKPFRSEPGRASSLPRQRSGPLDDASTAAQLWSQQQGKAEVVEMSPGQQPPGGGQWNQGPLARGVPGRNTFHAGMRGPPSTSSLPGAMSDSEALGHQPPPQRPRTMKARQKRSKQRRAMAMDGHHSENEMQQYEAPALPKDPQKSLQEAALETITAGLQNQPKVTPYRPLLPESERQVNYTRGVYRPQPVVWRGSSRSSGGSVSRYDDSSLVSSLWSQQHPVHTGESEGEADTEGDPSYYDDSPERRSASLGMQPQFNNSMERPHSYHGPPPPGHIPPQGHPGHMAGHPMHPGHHPGQHLHPGQHAGQPMHPGHHPGQPMHPGQHPQGNPPPSPKRPGQDGAPVRRRPRKKKKWVTEPGPVDFSEYGPTAKIWMEKVDLETVKKSDTMFLSVMPKEHKFTPEIETSMPADPRHSAMSMGDDDVFLPPQWVIARGRNMRRKKRQLDKQRQSAGSASGGSDLENDRPLTPGQRQMLLFFRVSSNWRDLGWVLFDKAQTDSETTRMIKDIELKHPNNLTNQVHDLMNRWWNKQGHDATIEELRRALDLVNIPYIMEECTDQRSSVAVYSGSEDNLDISQISDNDPNVSRLMAEYEVRSLNASYEGGALSDSEGRRSYNLSSDSLARRLNEKGVTINRSKLGSRSSLGRNSSRGYDSFDESADHYSYISDGEHSRSFVIVQPQLKTAATDYRHETNL